MEIGLGLRPRQPSTRRRPLVDGRRLSGLFGDFPAKRNKRRDVRVLQRLHPDLALHRRFQMGRQFAHFLLFAFSAAFLEFRHHLSGKNLQGLADVGMFVEARLLDADAPMDYLATLLSRDNPAVLVRREEELAGIVTRYDVLHKVAGIL